MSDYIEDFEDRSEFGKLGFGFTSADELEEIDIGPGDRPKPTYINAKSNPEYKQELIKILKKYYPSIWVNS